MPTTVPPLTAAEVVIASGLDPSYLPRMLAHRAADLRDGIPFELISGRRSFAQQQAEYAAYEERHRQWVAGGKVGPGPRPAAKPGTSKHELGYAYDRTGPRTDAEWARSAANAEALGLESGHRYNDRPHIEAPDDIAHIRTAIALRIAAAAAAFAVVVMVSKA